MFDHAWDSLSPEQKAVLEAVFMSADSDLLAMNSLADKLGTSHAETIRRYQVAKNAICGNNRGTTMPSKKKPTHERIFLAMKQLPPTLRKAAFEFFIVEASITEAAKKLGITTTEANARREMALIALKQRLPGLP